jgi:hypothetical protein
VAFGRNSVAANVNAVKVRLRGQDGAWADVVDLGVPNTFEQPVVAVLVRGGRAALFTRASSTVYDLAAQAAVGYTAFGFGPGVTHAVT